MFIPFGSEYHVLAHGIDNGVVVGAVAYDDKNGIVASYRSQNLGDVTVVNVVSYAAGISWSRADYPQVAREVDALEMARPSSRLP